MKYIDKKQTNKLGKEYLIELEECLKIREDRKKIYADSWLSESPKDLLVLIESKLKRYKISNNKLNKIDSLRDMINYTIFLLGVLNKNGK